MHCVDVGAPLGNSDHNTIQFNISVGEGIAGRFNTITFNFKRENISKIMGKEAAEREN